MPRASLLLPLPLLLLLPAPVHNAAHAAGWLSGVGLLYNNDGENLCDVQTPYRSLNGPLTPAVIAGAVNEVSVPPNTSAVQLLAPFHGVPWWNSTLEPLTRHVQWYDGQFNFTHAPNGTREVDFVLGGGDIVGTFAAAAAARGQRALISLRPNDGQACSFPPTPNNAATAAGNQHQFDHMAEFWWDHRFNASVLLNPPTSCCWFAGHAPNCSGCSAADCEMSWLSPVARARITGLIAELFEQYRGRLAGLEIDFQRPLDFFPSHTPQEVRDTVMRAWLAEVRAAIGPDAVLGLRVTPMPQVLARQGIGNLTALVADLGVAYLNWGTYFFSVQPFDTHVQSLARAVPAGTPQFFEVTSFTFNGPTQRDCRPPFRRQTKEELHTTALVARAMGLQALSAFNFIYTRPFYDQACQLKENAPFSEPLFEALGQTANQTFLRCCADQYYRLSANPDPNGVNNGTIPRTGRPLAAGQPHALSLFIVPADAAYRAGARLRLLIDWGGSGSVPPVAVSLNGAASLTPGSNTTSLYHSDNPPAAQYAAKQWLAWDLGAADLGAVLAGYNTVQITPAANLTLLHLDLALPLQRRP